MAKAVVAVKKGGRPLPPWLQKAKDEGAKEAKSGKAPSAAHEKGESKKFEAAEDTEMKKGKPFVNGGNVKVKSNATKPKASASNLPKGKGNAKGNVIGYKDGGKVK